MLINLNETQKKLDDIRSGKIKEGLKTQYTFDRRIYSF